MGFALFIQHYSYPVHLNLINKNKALKIEIISHGMRWRVLFRMSMVKIILNVNYVVFDLTDVFRVRGFRSFLILVLVRHIKRLFLALVIAV